MGIKNHSKTLENFFLDFKGENQNRSGGVGVILPITYLTTKVTAYITVSTG